MGVPLTQYGVHYTANLSYGREVGKIVCAGGTTVHIVVTPVKSTRGETGITQPHF